MLTVHHLGISQSERVVWLCEELEIEYKLVKHTRDPILAPESLTSLPGNKTGKAPFMEDPETGVALSESAAICEYIARKYGNDRLILGPSHKNFADYLYWFHYSNGTFVSKTPPIVGRVEVETQLLIRWLVGTE
jgi:glutathione S-transferase